MNANIINTKIFQLIKYSLKVKKGLFYVYINLNLRSYGQLFVLVLYVVPSICENLCL